MLLPPLLLLLPAPRLVLRPAEAPLLVLLLSLWLVLLPALRAPVAPLPALRTPLPRRDRSGPLETAMPGCGRCLVAPSLAESSAPALRSVLLPALLPALPAPKPVAMLPALWLVPLPALRPAEAPLCPMLPSYAFFSASVQSPM